jgi:hypothetical protein
MNLRGIESLAFLAAVTAVTSGCMDMELAPEETGAEPVASKTSGMTWCPGSAMAAKGQFVNFSGETEVVDGGVPDAGEDENPTPDAKLCGWQNGWTGTWYTSLPVGTQDTYLRAAEDYAKYGDQISTEPLSHLSTSFSVTFSQAWGSLWGTWAWESAPNQFSWIVNEVNGCAHPAMQTGAPLASGCTKLVGLVCASSGYDSCCTADWSQSCVNKAFALAGYGSNDPHSILVEGPGLRKKADEPPILTQGKAAMPSFKFPGGPNPWSGPINECAKEVCAISGYGYCCKESASAPGNWDSACVTKAINTCSTRYLAHPRYDADEDQVFVDVCVEPKNGGYATCPYKLTEVNGSKECCQRALAFEGVYQALDTKVDAATSGNRQHSGRYVEWYRKLNVKIPWGKFKVLKPVLVNSTIVEEPIHVLPDGSLQYLPKMSKLYEIRAHGIYTDCSPDSSRRPCTCPSWGGKVAPGNCIQGGPHNGVELRRIVLAVASALITTTGSWSVDLRWAKDPGNPWANTPQAPFGNPVTISGQFIALEAKWHAQSNQWNSLITARQGENGVANVPTTGNYHYWADPFCYSTDAKTRVDDDDLIANEVMHCEDVANIPFAAFGDAPIIETHWDKQGPFGDTPPVLSQD